MYPPEESLNLKVGDQVIWQDAEIKAEGPPAPHDTVPAIVSPGMKGQVVSLHEGAHLDVMEGGTIQARALVEFENGRRLLVNNRMKWEKVSKG